MSNLNEKVHSILMGRKVRKYNVIKDWGEPGIIEKTETLERIKIGEYDLPLLKENDEIFLSEHGVYTTIQKVTIGTDNNVYYNVSYVVEYINDEKINAKTMIDLNKLKEKYKKQQLEYEKECEITNKKNKEQEIQINNIIQWQKDNPDKIKGIIVWELPKGERAGTCSLNQTQQKQILENMILSFPKEYIVIPSLGEVSFMKLSDDSITIEKVKYKEN